MASTTTTLIPVYSTEGHNYLSSQDWTDFTFRPIAGDVGMGHGALDGREIGIAMSWDDSTLIGHIEAPAGSRVRDTDMGPHLSVGAYTLRPDEALSCAREGEFGLTWHRAVRL